jgi:Tfp pilus assembly protein PilX
MKIFTNYKLQITNPNTQTGVIAVYIILLVLLIVTSSAIAVGSILSRQIRSTERNIESERAFYAANSGVEEALFLLVQQNEQGGPGEVEIEDGQVIYDDAQARYTVRARLVVSESLTQSVPCIVSTGSYQGEVRRLRLQPPDVEC